MTMLPSVDDLAIVARHMRDERMRDAQNRRLIQIARSGDRDAADAKPMHAGLRSRLGRFGCGRNPFRRCDTIRSPLRTPGTPAAG